MINITTKELEIESELKKKIKTRDDRIKEPYFIKNKIATITKKDNDEILKIIKKYYAFEAIKETNKSNIRPIKRQNIVNNKSKENREKVLT